MDIYEGNLTPAATEDRLRNHFEDAPTTSHPHRWDSLWKDGSFLPWDRGQPSLALFDALSTRADLFGTPLSADGGRKRALVPGCGRGYDVLLLAAMGYDAYGLDVSANALEAGRRYAEGNFEKYAEFRGGCGVGKYEFVEADFFKDEWRVGMGAEEGFDVVFDYTFFCAFPPSMRPAWSLRQSQLLAPDGRLICLEFPSAKKPESGGPPHAVSPETYIAHLTHPGEKLEYAEDGYPEKRYCVGDGGEAVPGRRRLGRLAHWKAERTHKAGEGSDCLGVWGYE